MPGGLVEFCEQCWAAPAQIHCSEYNCYFCSDCCKKARTNIDNKGQCEMSCTPEDGGLEPEQKTIEYQVTVVAEVEKYTVIEVEARTEQEAKDMALKQARNMSDFDWEEDGIDVHSMRVSMVEMSKE